MRGKDLENVSSNIEQSSKKKKVIRGITIAGISVVLALCLLKGCSSQDYNPTTKPAVALENSDYIERQQEQPQSAHIDIPILEDFEVSATNPYIALSNPETNADKFYLQYEFYADDNKEPIYTSKYVEAGKKFSADVYNALGGKAGTYHLQVKVRTFSVDDLTEKNGITNKVTVTII